MAVGSQARSLEAEDGTRCRSHGCVNMEEEKMEKAWREWEVGADGTGSENGERFLEGGLRFKDTKKHKSRDPCIVM
jgi:hypothetical protein